jgi:hypothetical protein
MVYELLRYILCARQDAGIESRRDDRAGRRGNNYGVNHGYWTAEFGALNQIWHPVEMTA